MATFGIKTGLGKLSIASFAIILVAVLINSPLAVATSPSFSDAFLHSRQASSTDQDKTDSLNKLRDNVHCYALPYGGLGFGSHVLTYYCMFVNAYGRRPLVPWKRQKYQKLDVLIGFLQLTGTTITGTLTITRCKGEGHLQLLGIWMLLTSAASSVAAMLGHGRWLFASRSKDAARGIEGSTPPAPITYDPNVLGPPEPTYEPPDIPQYNIPLHPYYTQPKPYPLTSYYSTPQYEAVNMRGGSGRRDFFSRDKGDFRQEGNKYGQWVSWGLIISLWLVGCAMGFIGSIGIAREVWKTIAKVREITTWFFMPAMVMLGLTILLCLCVGKKKPDGTYEHTEGEAKAVYKMSKWTSKVYTFTRTTHINFLQILRQSVTMPLTPLTPRQKDAVCEYLRAYPQRPIELKPLMMALKSPVRRLSDTLRGRASVLMDQMQYDPTGPHYPLRTQVNLYDRLLILEIDELSFEQEYKAMLAHVRNRVPEGLVLMYDFADRESFTSLEGDYRTVCQEYSTIFAPPEPPEPPAGGLFKRTIDRFFRKIHQQVPARYPIMVIAVHIGLLSQRPRQVTYEEGLELSNRLGASFCETYLAEFDFHVLEEFVCRIILTKVEAEPKRSRRERKP